MTLQLAAPLGCQTPRIHSVPPRVSSAGQEAVELAALTGLVLDPWQDLTLDGALGEDAAGQFVANEVGLVAPRQDGKGGIIEAATLEGLYQRAEAIVYTAHLMSTSRKMQDRIQNLIESAPDLDREVKQVRISNEERSIALKSGARIDFAARSESNARGWSADRVFLDEAFAVTVEQVGALMPVMIARRNWQLWWVSMAGKAYSHPLRGIRRRGIAGERGLAYLEWSIPGDVYRAAPEYVANMPAAWAQAKPALGIRTAPATIAALQRSMDPVEFAREVLGVWDDPRGVPLIDPLGFAALADPGSYIAGPAMVFGLGVSPDQVSGAIGVAGYRFDGIQHAEITGRDGILDHRRGIDWMIGRAKALNEQWKPAAWVLDPSGPAGGLLTGLRLAGIDPKLVTGRDMTQAAGSFVTMATAPLRDRLRHLGQQPLIDAVAAAKKRDIGDGAWTWGRKASDDDICPLEAITLALHGLAVWGQPTPPVPEPQSAGGDGATSTSETADLARAGF